MSADHDDHHPRRLQAVPDERTPPMTPEDIDRVIVDQLEQGILGALLTTTNPDHADTLIDTLGEPAAFTNPAAAHAWTMAADTWVRTGRCDTLTVATHLQGQRPTVDPLWLLGCTSIDHLPATHAHALQWAAQVRQRGRHRELLSQLTRAAQVATTDPERLPAVLDRVQELARPAVAIGAVRVPTIAEDMALLGEDQEPDWVIPDMLARGDRLLLTGIEGSGKSTLLRQIAFQVATGLHPFGGDSFDPVRVLFIDVENPEDIFRREVRPLWLKVADRIDPDNFRIDRALGGLDLAKAVDYEWLRTRIADARPDLLLIGPLYKLAGPTADSNEERDMKPVAFALDRLRAEYGFALICETHSNKMVKDGQRSMEPNGWSGWLRWPEFGYCLTATDEFRSWRGDRSKREWPTSLRRGGAWPFSADNTITDHRWRTIRGALGSANRRLTEREIATATDLPKTAVHRTIEARRDLFDNLWKMLPGDEDAP